MPPAASAPTGSLPGRRRPRWRWWGTKAAGLLALTLVAGGCREAPPPPILAGAGSGSFLDAMRLAVEDGGTGEGRALADTVFRIEVSSRSVPALAVAEELVALPGLVAVIGHANSVASLATSQVYNREGVVQIAPTSTAALYSEAGPFSFRMVPPDDHQGAFLAGVLADSLPSGSRLALLFVNDDYGRGLRASVLEHLDPERHPVVLDLPHTEGDVEPMEVEHAVEAIQSAGVDALVWLGRVPPLNALLPSLREAVGEIPVIGGDALSRGVFIEAIPPSWNGVLHVDFLDAGATPELREFQERYRTRFGPTLPMGAPAGPEVLSYDAAAVVLAALREGARTGDEVREYLVSLGRTRPPHPGLSGPVAFDEAGNVSRGYVLRRIQVEGPPEVSP